MKHLESEPLEDRIADIEPTEKRRRRMPRKTTTQPTRVKALTTYFTRQDGADMLVKAGAVYPADHPCVLAQPQWWCPADVDDLEFGAARAALEGKMMGLTP